MIYTLAWVMQFSASHVLQGHATCGLMHGHTFRVRVRVTGDPDPDIQNLVADDQELFRRIAELGREINGRHLNDMLPGAIPSAQGVANWFWERLALHYQLDEVTVWQDDLEASLRREQ